MLGLSQEHIGLRMPLKIGLTEISTLFGLSPLVSATSHTYFKPIDPERSTS